MSATNKQLLAWLHNLRTQASKGPIDGGTLDKHRTVISAIINSGENLNFAISAAKICPAAVDVNTLTAACRKYAPAWIDSLLSVEGVDRHAIQADIIRRQHPSDAVSRILTWYPGHTPLPSSVQRQWSELVHDLCKRETSTGTAYQRRLTVETGNALLQAVKFLGNKIDDPSAATWILRASHYVLKATTRSVPLLHMLPDDFADTTLESLWGFAMNQTANREEWRINAQAFTLANTEAFPEARAWLTMHYPKESAVVNKLWDKHALQVSAYFTAERHRHGISTTIVQRDGDWTPPTQTKVSGSPNTNNTMSTLSAAPSLS